MPVNILVVDDEPFVLETVSLLLADEAYEVTTTDNGKAALAVLRQGFSGLMLLDIMMPELDGWDTLRIAESEKLLDSVLVCMLTAVVDPGEKAEFASALVFEYLTKPFSDSEFYHTVERCISYIRQTGS